MRGLHAATPRRVRAFGGALPAAALAAGIALSGRPAQASFPASDSLVKAGFENVLVDTSSGAVFEDRRHLNPAYSLGVAEAHLAPGAEADSSRPPLGLWPSRLALPLARVEPGSGPDGGTSFAVTYPGEPGAAPPHGPRLSPSAGRFDFTIRPLLDYELGRLYDPVLVRIGLAPEVLVSPWPGAQAIAGVIFPLRDDFEPDPLHPDVNQVRPSRLVIHQFGWLPGTLLASGSFGYFGENRWGFSAGAARPLAQGDWLLDAQVDWTGMVAFNEDVTEYSWPEVWTATGAVTWRTPYRDLSLTARGARYLFGDEGFEAEVTRSFSDVDVSFYLLHTLGESNSGFRVSLPLPPMTRPWPRRVRFMLPERYTLGYLSESSLGGAVVTGTASRDAMLRGYNRRFLDSNAKQYQAARAGRKSPAGPPPADPGISHAGTSGFINTPWAGVLPDRTLEVGYQHVPREWTYDHRGTHDNEVYYAALGFLPALEVGIRWTVIPGLKTLSELVPDSKLTDSDRGLAARLQLLAPGKWPGLAAGVEDAYGTRRFHATYLVTGLPVERGPLKARLTLGYAERVFEATQRTLDGGFGAVEFSPLDFLSTAIEHDTEKWNVQVRLALWRRIQLRATWLDLSTFSAGVGFRHRL
jgi:hypothetical protein